MSWTRPPAPVDEWTRPPSSIPREECDPPPSLREAVDWWWRTEYGATQPGGGQCCRAQSGELLAMGVPRDVLIDTLQKRGAWALEESRAKPHSLKGHDAYQEYESCHKAVVRLTHGGDLVPVGADVQERCKSFGDGRVEPHGVLECFRGFGETALARKQCPQVERGHIQTRPLGKRGAIRVFGFFSLPSGMQEASVVGSYPGQGRL